jgi:hypothetical protein
MAVQRDGDAGRHDAPHHCKGSGDLSRCNKELKNRTSDVEQGRAVRTCQLRFHIVSFHGLRKSVRQKTVSNSTFRSDGPFSSFGIAAQVECAVRMTHSSADTV